MEISEEELLQSINPQEKTGLSEDEVFGEPTAQTFAGDIAAGLRGVRESIPFGQDIGAGANYLTGMVTGRGPETFEEAKRQQIEQDKALSATHPWSYAAGVAGGLGAQVLAGLPSAARAGQLVQTATAPLKVLPAVTGKVEEAIARKAAPYVGETAAKLGSIATTGAGTGALYGAGQGATPEERLEGAVSGAEFGAGLGLLGEGLVKGAQKAKLIGRPPATPPLATTRDNLKQLAQQAYDATTAAGLTIKREPVAAFHNDLATKLTAAGYRPGRHGELKDALDELYKIQMPSITPGSTKFVSLSDLDRVSQFANDAVLSKDPVTRRLGAITKEAISDFTNKLDARHILAGDKDLALASLKDAKDMWQRQSKLTDIENIIENAKIDSEKSRAMKSWYDITQDNLSNFLKKIRANRKGWTDDEIKLIEDVTKPSPLLKRYASFDPFKSRTGAIAAGALATHNVGLAAAQTGATHGASKYIENQTIEKLDKLKDLISAGGKRHMLPRPVKPSMEKASRLTRQTMIPYGAISFAPDEQDMDKRTTRAAGGKIGKKDYPAKRLTRMEKAVKRAQEAIALETRPIMNMPDEAVAQALHLAKDK